MVLPVPTASLEGKYALVTGASRGIGRGIALELAKRGASVAINYAHSADQADQVCREIENLKVPGVRAITVKADVSKAEEIRQMFTYVAKAFERDLDIVVSNSGTEFWSNIQDVTESNFDHVFGLNTRAQFFVAQAAYSALAKNGRLILMSSIAAGLRGIRDHALYSASKMAIVGLVTSFATDFSDKQITVNGIAPGGIKSDMFAENAWHYIPGATPDWSADQIESQMAQHCPLQRCAVPEDVARVVAFLASEDGGWINGQVITVSGGSAQ